MQWQAVQVKVTIACVPWFGNENATMFIAVAASSGSASIVRFAYHCHMCTRRYMKLCVTQRTALNAQRRRWSGKLKISTDYSVWRPQSNQHWLGRILSPRSPVLFQHHPATDMVAVSSLNA